MKRRRRVQRHESDSDDDEWQTVQRSSSPSHRPTLRGTGCETIEIIDLEEESSNQDIAVIVEQPAVSTKRRHPPDTSSACHEKRGKSPQKRNNSKECSSQYNRIKPKEQKSVLQFMVPKNHDVEHESSLKGPKWSRMETNPNVRIEDTQETGQLWVDKYRPLRSDDLVIQAKKVQEFESWLERNHRLLQVGDAEVQRVLVLHGPCGTGKSALVEVVSRQLGFKVVEWSCSASVSFEQHRSADLSYASDLDQLSGFLRAANKFAPLETSVNADKSDKRSPHSETMNDPSVSRTSKVLIVVEDFPNIFGQPQIEGLERILDHLRTCGRHLTVLIKSDDQGRGDGRQLAGVLRRLMGMSAVGSIHVNKVAITSMRKCLASIVSKERFNGIDDYSLQQIAESCDGDVRNGINALQMFCKQGLERKALDMFGKKSKELSVKRSKGKKSSKGRANEPALPSTAIRSYGRDHSLVIFSALGRILHNKRLEDTEPSADPNRRAPLAFVPEDILARSGLGGDLVMGYLHENLIPFFDDMDDVADALSYLSDGDMLSSSKVGRFTSSIYSGPGAYGGLGGDYGFSVASRGVLWSNRHVVSKYTALRRPGVLRAQDAGIRVSEAVRPMLTPPLQEICSLSPRSIVREVLPFLAQWSRQPGAGRLTVAQQTWLRRASSSIAFAGLAPNSRLRSSFMGGSALRTDDAEDSEVEELVAFPKPCAATASCVLRQIGLGREDSMDPIHDFSD